MELYCRNQNRIVPIFIPWTQNLCCKFASQWACLIFLSPPPSCMFHFINLLLADDSGVIKCLLSLLFNVTKRGKSLCQVMLELSRDIHSQLGDIDQVGFVIPIQLLLGPSRVIHVGRGQMYILWTFSFYKYSGGYHL